MYSIIDIESNGGGFREEIIIEIAIYRFDGHKIVDQFSSLINPEADITNFVQKGNKLIITYRLGNLLLDEKIHMSRVSKFDREKLRSDIKTELHIYNPDILR